MEARKNSLRFGEYLLLAFYLIGIVVFIVSAVTFAKDGNVAGLFTFTKAYMLAHPNAIKWTLGAFFILFAATYGGLGMWIALLHLVVGIWNDAGETPGVIAWWVAMIAGFKLTFQGPRAFWNLCYVLHLGPYSEKSRVQKQEALQVANPSAGGRKGVTNPRAFDNLVGVDKAIQEFKDALELPIVHPELMKEYHIEPTRGIILYGPPGTGKTSLARAVADYFNVPFVYHKASAFGGMYVGTTESNVRQLFVQARDLAAEKHSRVIIFLDEIDAIARKRDGGHHNRPSDLVLNPLLEELDGFKKESAIFLIAATNRLDVLDEAILRPGRLDKRIEVGYPDEKARGELFKLYLKGVPLCESDEIAEQFDEVMAECAQRWDRISPADIKEICQRVKVNAATRQASTKEAGIRAEDIRKEVGTWSQVPSG